MSTPNLDPIPDTAKVGQGAQEMTETREWIKRNIFVGTATPVNPMVNALWFKPVG